jgi:hypothetical protein
VFRLVSVWTGAKGVAAEKKKKKEKEKEKGKKRKRERSKEEKGKRLLYDSSIRRR